MVIALNSEQTQVIDKAVQAGVIRDADEAVEVGMKTIRLRLEAKLSLPTALTAEEWSRQFHAWIDSHSTTGPLLSDEAIDRESIYGDRGL
jgi:hypothetical protein